MYAVSSHRALRRIAGPRNCAGVLVLALAGTFVALLSSLPSLFVAPGPLTNFRRPAAAALGRRSATWPVARQQASQDGAAEVKKGARMQVNYENVWYDCEILAVSEDGTKCTAKYDEGDDEEEDIEIASRIREIPPPMALTKGQRVEVWSEGVYYDCEILAVSEDGTTCTAKYDEGGDEEEDIDVRERVREPRIKFADLTQGQKFTGTIQSVASFGAFVDIGAERDGLVHISKIANERIDNIDDYVQQGQEVEVWVSEVRDDGKLALSMVESKVGAGGGPRAPSDYSGFMDVSPDQWLTGVVASIAPFGIFVTVTPPGGGATADGLVHITAIRDGFVENTADEASVGQEVQVRVKSVDAGMGRMSLSMKADDGFGGGGGGGPREEADLTPFEKVAGDSQWLKGKVARIAPFGLFVTVSLEDGATADGLVHITQIRDGFVESCEDEAEVGQEVDVWIQSVDPAAGKMSLSMKQAE